MRDSPASAVTAAVKALCVPANNQLPPDVEAAVRGETAKMSAIKRLSDQPYRIETEMVDVTQVANFEKKVPDEWITADGMHVNANFERYARPLIQAELTPIYINGVPRHIHLD